MERAGQSVQSKKTHLNLRSDIYRKYSSVELPNSVRIRQEDIGVTFSRKMMKPTQISDDAEVAPCYPTSKKKNYTNPVCGRKYDSPWYRPLGKSRKEKLDANDADCVLNGQDENGQVSPCMSDTDSLPRLVSPGSSHSVRSPVLSEITIKPSTSDGIRTRLAECDVARPSILPHALPSWCPVFSQPLGIQDGFRSAYIDCDTTPTDYDKAIWKALICRPSPSRYRTADQKQCEAVCDADKSPECVDLKSPECNANKKSPACDLDKKIRIWCPDCDASVCDLWVYGRHNVETPTTMTSDEHGGQGMKNGKTRECQRESDDARTDDSLRHSPAEHKSSFTDASIRYSAGLFPPPYKQPLSMRPSERQDAGARMQDRIDFPCRCSSAPQDSSSATANLDCRPTWKLNKDFSRCDPKSYLCRRYREQHSQRLSETFSQKCENKTVTFQSAKN